MHTTGTHIAYFHLCHRKLWLFANGINMEQESALVAEGKFIQEASYQNRASKWQEVAVEGIKIDHFDAKKGIVREVKKSNKREYAHVAQLKYYLFVLQRNGIKISHGLLEYPRLREREEVWLEKDDLQIISDWEEQVKRIISQPDCPPFIQKTICKKCAYRDFCLINNVQ